MDIDGRIEGPLDIGGRVRVGERGLVTGPVSAGALSVLGRVQGGVRSVGTVHIASGGIIVGDVRAARVALDDGGALDGVLDMDVELPPELLGEPEEAS